MIITDRQDELGAWYVQQVGGVQYAGQWAFIGLERNGKIVAVAGYNEYYGASIRGHIAIKGRVNREFLHAIFYYPFEQLKVKKLLGFVSGGNARALKFDLHLGFISETVIEDAFNSGACHLLSMTKEQCRFLNNRL